MSRRIVRPLLALALMAGFAAPVAAQTPAPSAPPKLIVFIAVDQLRANMLERYRGDLHAGYARLMTGAWFTNAFQDHAITETAPGHASMMSGRFPASTGITMNSVGVVDAKYPLINALRSETGASPDRFQGTTLTDWLHSKDPRSRAFSVSMKDRAAILPIGKSKQNVYWYSGNGSFTTSTYYRDTLPSWVTAFNARGIPLSYAGAFWKLTAPLSVYPEPDSIAFEHGGTDFMFPHPFPATPAGAATYIKTTPSIDSITALFALEGLKQTGVGLGPQTDVMSVSFSATDYIGHAFGPDSREAHDNEIHLDQTLGWFLDSLFKLRDPNTVMIALTGDHGVSPIPELARQRGEATGDQGLRVNLRSIVTPIRAAVLKAGADSNAFVYDGEILSLNRAALARAGINADSLLDAFTAAVKVVPGIARVDRMADLRKADPDRDPIARRWVHQIPVGSPVEIAMTLTRYSYWNTSVATHGSPYDQDASVPIIFYGPWIKPGVYMTFTRTVDIAPTLAAIAGATPTERLDGVVLKAVIR